MRELAIDRTIPRPFGDTVPALDAALRTALGDKCTGLAYSNGVVRVQLTPSATADDENAAIQIVKAHDFATRSPEQTALAQRKADLLEIISTKADTAIATIGTELTTLASDETALAAAASLAAVKPIVADILAIMKAQDIRQRALLKGIQRLADLVT